MRLIGKTGPRWMLQIALLAAGSASAMSELPPVDTKASLDDSGPMVGTLPSYATVAMVNRAVNATTRYVADVQRFGRSDLWMEADGSGDCEDFVLDKRRRLLAQGVPPNAMRIVTARVKTSQFGRARGHAVLVVMTTEGEWVLDMIGEPSRRQDLDYQWVKIQQGSKWYLVAN
jgi:predicted transglutaminase-like cysteine proteinase